MKFSRLLRMFRRLSIAYSKLITHYIFFCFAACSTLVEKLNVNRFGSRITLLNANDGSVFINTTSTLSEFYSQWNITAHNQQQAGLNLPNVLRNLRSLTQTEMDVERVKSSVGGRAMVAVIVAQVSGVPEAEGNFAAEQVAILREQVPDLNLLFFAGGAITRFERFVRNAQHDLFPLQPAGSSIDSDSQISIYTTPIISRIEESKCLLIFNCSRRQNNSIPRTKQNPNVMDKSNDNNILFIFFSPSTAPRRIINHRCGSDWRQNDWGSNTMDQYVEPATINYYRVHPNYFYLPGSNRYVRIQNHGYGQVNVCSSRWVERPR